MTREEKREYLKSKGWRRQDRAVGPYKSVELWLDPHGTKYGVGLKWAYNKQKKRDGNALRSVD